MSSMAAVDEQAVLGALDAFYGAWADADPDAMAQHYTDDAAVTMPGVFHRGRDGVRQFFAAGFAARLRGSRPLDESRALSSAADGAAIVTSEGGILMAGETSLPPERRIRATWVLTRRDGGWLIAAYHNCPFG